MIDLLNNEAWETVNKLLAELRQHASEGIPIIVEGKCDVSSLKKLGIEGCFHKVSNGKSLLHFVEGFSSAKKVIVLPDFDRTGDKLANFIAKHMKRSSVEPITEFRDKLKSLVRREVKDIEGMAKFLQTQQAQKKKVLIYFLT